MWSAARSAKISMILCMPERVSGGDAKFQGFCHRWNKWEGQSLQGLTPSKRGRKPAERNPLSAKVHELEAKVARLEKELHTAHTILDVQGKVAGLLGFSLEHGKDC